MIKTNASDLDVCRAAWVSNYADDAVERDATPERQAGLINFLYTNKHMSPFEHGSFTFFVDTPIFVAREFFRHRTASYNETSGRYKMLDGRFYIPSPERPLFKVKGSKVGNYKFELGTKEDYEYLVRELSKAYEEDWDRYRRLLAHGFANEVARMSLPVGIMTQFYVTINPRNLMQLLSLRNAPEALEEIRAVAVDLEQILEQTMPLTHAAYKGMTDK